MKIVLFGRGVFAVLLAALLVPVALAAPDAIPRLPNGEPILRMPFPAGTVVLCQQGNCSPKGHSHSSKNTNCTHALDLNSVVVKEQVIVSAAPGRVVKVNDLAKPGDTKAGNGFGKYVKVDHGNEYFTFYAHLKDVSVKNGDAVSSGSVIGIMGNTGNAGNDHLHFSLHKGHAEWDGTCTTVPIHAMITQDMNSSAEFGLYTSLEFVGAGSEVTAKGHRYGSENSSAREFLLGNPGVELEKDLEISNKALVQKLGATTKLQEILDAWRDGNVARRQLERIVRDDPKNYEAWYWIGVASIRDLSEPARAREALNKILQASPAPEEPGWILPWSHFRMGEVEEAENGISAAIVQYKIALKHPEQGSQFLKQVKASLARCEKHRK